MNTGTEAGGPAIPTLGKKSEPLHVVFAGGGTGGHLYPGLAVANALAALRPDARITFFTTTRELDRTLLQRTAFGQVPQTVRPFTLHPLRVPGFLLAWRRSVRAATEFLRREGVQAVLGLGGYAAGPPVVAAQKLGLRTGILNPDAIPGRANRHLSTKVDLVAMQWEVSARYLPDGAPCRVLGCPIRPEFAQADGEAGRRLFGLEAGRPVLLVTGASQGARSVNQTVVKLWPRFVAEHPEWQLLHLTGLADEMDVRAGYEQAGVAARVLGFTHDMAAALAAADVVISRAGASTLAELTALGKASILLPYPYHRDQHQHANARVLVDAGAALLVEDHKEAELNAPGLWSALQEVVQPETRARMARAAATLGRAEAATALARWLVTGAL